MDKILMINDAEKKEMDLQEKHNGNEDRTLDKLVSTNQEMHHESDNLMHNAVPCGQYQAMDSGDPIQLDEMEDGDEREQATKRKKKHRRRRMRCISQSSTGAVAGRRSTFSSKVGKKYRRRQLYGTSAPPRHVHGNDWREMMEITKQKDEGENIQLAAQSLYRSEDEELNKTDDIGGEELRAIEAENMTLGDKFPSADSISQQITPSATREREMARMRYMSGGSSLQCDWIEETFSKRECVHFMPSSKDSNKCGCGRYKHQHAQQTQPTSSQGMESLPAASRPKRWSIQKNTELMPTDAYGTIEFQGGPHPFKAQYLRLSFDSDPADIMCLFEHIWEMEPPKLIITIHGGITNFDLQPKLARVFRKGLLKAARTTGAWIFTSGVNAGVVRQVAAALESAIPTSAKSRKIVSVGIAPWGLLKRREDFIGRDKVVLYHPQSFPPKTRFAVLNNRHSFFLLVDNGTVGRYGADIILRRRLESYIAEKQKIGGGNRSVPVVCVVLEGGTCTIRTVLDYVTTIPKVPVVICDGSGRASDLLAFAHQYIQEDGNLPEVIRPQLLSLIEDVFFYDKHNAQCLFLDILACVRQRNLITVFRLLGENQKQDVDYAILTALLKGQNLSPAEQLSLALAWNRVDIARSDIFIMGQDWPKSALHNAMMEALIHNRVDFVRLLLENGVSMHEFLTIARLEELYNTDQGPPNTLYYIVRDVVKIRAGYRYKLPHIGMAIEKLMANGFRSHYTSTQFRQKYTEYKNKLKESQRRYHHHHTTSHHSYYYGNDPMSPNSYQFPFNYQRSNTEFFTRGLGIVPGFRPRGLRTSASDTKLGYGGVGAVRMLSTQPQAPLNQDVTTGGGIDGIHPTSTGTTTRINSVASQHPIPHSFYHQPHFYSTNNFAAIPTVSGSRALSNHLLWRTAYRRDNNPAAIKPQPHRKIGMVAQSAQQQFSSTGNGANILNDVGMQKSATTSNVFFNDAIGYAAEADESLNAVDGQQKIPDFRYPFSDLLIWAVLTKRHEMALCMWQHGEEAMAKSLVACRLYKSLAKEAAEDYLEVEVCEELKKYAEEFMQLSLELLDHCYKQDDAQTLQLLTYELSYWGQETCLSLAVIVRIVQFLAHPCCQILLADLWHGGLRIRSNSNLKVILGILFPPSIFLLEFKSREELMLQPQTAAEHQNDINDTSSSSDSSSSSSSSSESDSEIEVVSDEAAQGGNGTDKGLTGTQFSERRRASHGSMQSLNFTSIFQSKRKRTHRQSSQMAPPSGTATTDLELGKTKSRECQNLLDHRSHLAHHHSTIAASKEHQDTTRTKRSATTRSTNRPTSIALGHPTNQNETADKTSERANMWVLPRNTQHDPGRENIDLSKTTPISKQATGKTASHNVTPVTPLQIDTNTYNYNRHEKKNSQQETATTTIMKTAAKSSIPQFTLGSIGEHADIEEEETGHGSLTAISSPARESHLDTSNRTAETAIGVDYPNSNSPQCQQGCGHCENKDEAERNAQSPVTRFASPTRWNLGRHLGLAKALDYIGSGRQTVNGGYVPKGIPLPEGVTLNKKRQIKFRRKLYEFFVAPITTFWAWTLSFVVFLSVLTYVLLIRTPSVPTYFEWYLLAYVVAFGIEITRKFIMSEPKKLLEKLQYFFGNYWNFLTAVAIVGFIIGFMFRLNPITSKTIGRVVLAVDSVLWTIKLLDFLGVFPRFGPYITMAGKMIMNMSSIVVMLGISLLGFGLARQSITYPNEEWHWLLLRNVFYKPYFMLYGEVYADEIDTCGDEAWDEHLEKNISIANAWVNRDEHARELSCVPGHWIPPFLMVVFLLIANILLISMLIAIFNNIFESTNKISQQIWLFQRYRQVMEYEATPFLPPPFTPIYHVYMIIRYLSYRRMPSCRCLSAPIGRMLGVTCFCFCSSRRRKISKADCKADNEKEKVIPLAKNAFEQRQNFQNGDNMSRKQQERLALFDFSLKLFLTDDQVEKLHDFEEECMEDLAREKEYERNRTSEERLHRTCERTEMILLRVNDLSSKETMLKGNVRELETRIEIMENKQTEILDYLRQLNTVMPALVQSLQFLQQSPQVQQQHGKSPFQQTGIGSHLNIPTSSSFTQIECSHQTENGIMAAHSESHISSGKLSNADQKDSDCASRNFKTSKPPLYTSLSAEQTTSTSSCMRKTPTMLLPLETREQRAQSTGSTIEQQSGGITGGSTGSSMLTIHNPLKANSSVNTNQQQRLAHQNTFAAGQINAHRRTRTTTIGGNDLPSFVALLTPDAADAYHHQQRLFGSVVSLEPNSVIAANGVGANVTGSSITMAASRKNTQRWHRQNDEYTSITDTINVEQIGTAKVSSVTAVPLSTSVVATARVGTVIDDSESIERSIEELEEESQSSPRYSQTERLVNDAVQTDDEDEEEDLEEEEDEAEDEMDEDEADFSSLERRNSRSNRP